MATVEEDLTRQQNVGGEGKKSSCSRGSVEEKPSSASSPRSHPIEALLEKGREWKCQLTDLSFAKRLDSEDPLHHLRHLFHYPKKCHLPDVDMSLASGDDEESVYLCGNSLGLMPKSTADLVNRELVKWSKMGVHGHKHGELPWELCDEFLVDQMASLVGGQSNEVAVMNGLTVNEHLLLISFYQPTKERHKILIEDHAFPSDHFCAESQIRQRGFDPATSLVLVTPRQGEENIRTEDILQKIDAEGDSIAVILLPGVHYFTGQVFDMAAITAAGQAKGCFVGFDLAHAVGNIELFMHDWNVDFACWCTYKYLSSGAGGLAGIYIHERYTHAELPKLTGWWGHRYETRFDMDNKFDAIPGPSGYRLSNPPGLLAAALQGSLQLDRREPNVLRVAPLPMYNSFEDVHRFISHLHNAFRRIQDVAD